MNPFKTEFEQLTSEHLLQKRAFGDELVDEAHTAIEEVFAERGEHLPPRPSAPIIPSDITEAPSKSAANFKTVAILLLCLFAIGLAKAAANTWAGLVVSAVAVVYLLVDRARRANLTPDQQERERSEQIAARDKLNPLMVASASGDLVRVKELVAFGQGVNVPSLAGTTALMYAARNGHLEVVRYLLEHGADASVETEKGSTAVSLATKFGHSDVAQALTMKDSFTSSPVLR